MSPAEGGGVTMAALSRLLIGIPAPFGPRRPGVKNRHISVGGVFSLRWKNG